MTKEQLEVLRVWVQAEIEYAIAANEVGEDGYRVSAHNEQQDANNKFEDLIKCLSQSSS